MKPVGAFEEKDLPLPNGSRFRLGIPREPVRKRVGVELVSLNGQIHNPPPMRHDVRNRSVRSDRGTD